MSDNKVTINNHKFGVEFEMVGITREQLANIIAEHFKTKYDKLEKVPEDTQHIEDQFKIADKKNRYWKVVYDRSIVEDEKYRVELVTPVLTLDDKKELGEIISKVKQAGAKVNNTCGLHIHVDASVHTPDSITTLINSVANNNDIMVNAFKIDQRRRKMYCYDLDYTKVTTLNHMTYKSMSNIRGLFNSKNNMINFLNISDDKNAEKNTVELRFFNGTLDMDKIEANIMFALSLSTYSINKKTSISSLIRTFKNAKLKKNEDYRSYAALEYFKTLEIQPDTISQLMNDIYQDEKLNSKNKKSFSRL